jgi:glutamine amidotransferase
MIVILNLNSGNLEALKNAVLNCGHNCIISNPNEIPKSATHVILPGVGNYNSSMNFLKSKDYVNPIIEFVKLGKPVLGICLGMQLLSSFGSEPDKTSGLDLIYGEVSKIKTDLPLPHVGWNEVKFLKDHKVLADIPNNSDFYFVHSSRFRVKNLENIFGTTNYGKEFCSIASYKNIFAVQFHPEKSQKKGLKLIKNFCNWNGL